MTDAVLNTYFNATHPKRPFNPGSKEDLKAYKRFVDTGGWGGPCPFELEIPYLEIPYMISDKIARHTVAKIK